MKKITVVLMLLTVVAKSIGFVREIVLSYFYGASGISDAYLISTTIPTVIFVFIGTGIATSFIPIYSQIEKDLDGKAADRFTSHVLNFVLMICAAIVLVVVLFTTPIVKLFASGFEGETLRLAVTFTRITIVGIFFSAFIYVFSGYLQMKQRFTVVALMSIPLNIVLMIAMFVSAKYDLMYLAIGTVVAMALEMLYLFYFVYRKGFRYSFSFDYRNPYLKQLMLLSLPVVIGVSVNQINMLIDRTIASQLAVGGISALTYSTRFTQFIQGMFVASIATVMYPMIAKMAVENNMTGLKKNLAEAISGISLLVVPITVGTLVFAEPIVRLLFGRGAFDAEAVHLTSSALFFYSFGLLGYGLREVLSRAFYSLQDTKTPMINAAIAMGLNIVLNLILSRYMGIGGLALATSISATFCTILLFFSLRKKIGMFGNRKLAVSFAKIFAASLIMGTIARYSFDWIQPEFGLVISFILSVGVGCVIYFGLIYFMRIEEIQSIMVGIKRKVRRRSAA